jgi:pimeloyl-ACP methyl ester carboxylesterase
VSTTCSVGERTYAFDRKGAGPPLLVLNGFAATKGDWDPAFLAALAGEHELILVDNRGMGGSSDDGHPFTVQDLAEDVESLIEALGLERPAILGWSMGGYIALAHALAHPDRASKLVLLSTSGGGQTSTLGTEEVRERLRDLSGTPREQASRLISLLFPPERARQIDAEFGDVVAAARAALPADVVRRQWEAMEAWEGREDAVDLGGIACPVLVATGTDDVVIPAANAAALADTIPGAWLARFPHSGHGFMADHPQALGRLIGTFLSVD